MSVFRFHLIGRAPPVELDMPSSTIADLYSLISCQRFIEGRLTQADDDGVLAGVLLATNRIECVSEVT